MNTTGLHAGSMDYLYTALYFTGVIVIIGVAAIIMRLMCGGPLGLPPYELGECDENKHEREV